MIQQDLSQFHYSIHLLESNKLFSSDNWVNQGAALWDIETDFPILYENFSLISYLSDGYQVRVLKRVCEKNEQCEIFTIGGNRNKEQCTQFRLTKIRKDPSVKKENIGYDLKKPLRLKFYLRKESQKDRRFEIQVKFSKVQKKTFVNEQGSSIPQGIQRRYLLIEISSEKNFIEVLDKEKQKTEQRFQISHRMVDCFRPSKGQTQYYYLEGKAKRNKIIKGKHINLALQGGGVKGIQYIGAYKALLTELKGVPITSIIGSSAGGIIGLAICCDMTPEEIMNDLGVEYLSKVMEDITYSRPQDPVLDYCREFMISYCPEFSKQQINEQQLIDEWKKMNSKINIKKWSSFYESFEHYIRELRKIKNEISHMKYPLAHHIHAKLMQFKRRESHDKKVWKKLFKPILKPLFGPTLNDIDEITGKWIEELGQDLKDDRVQEFKKQFSHTHTAHKIRKILKKKAYPPLQYIGLWTKQLTQLKNKYEDDDPKQLIDFCTGLLDIFIHNIRRIPEQSDIKIVEKQIQLQCSLVLKKIQEEHAIVEAYWKERIEDEIYIFQQEEKTIEKMLSLAKEKPSKQNIKELINFYQVKGESPASQLAKIRKFLQKYLFEEDIIELVFQTLSDYKIQKLILRAIGLLGNTEMRKLFKTKIERSGKTRFIDKLNIKGLLNCALMNGGKVEKIGITAIDSLYKKLKKYEGSEEKSENAEKWRIFQHIAHEKRKRILSDLSQDERILYEKFCAEKISDVQNENKNLLSLLRKLQEKQQNLLFYQQNNKSGSKNIERVKKLVLLCEEEWKSKLTLRQLYQITGKEFTCTTVDIDDHILRFLNHKTTPQLPACKAIQLTGSFPLAFEAQHWKKQWGKYKIHYHQSRREIDITQHQFTDGGMLANFPVQYLDNQSMRPMYFSHKQTDETLMYGFGIKDMKGRDQIQDNKSSVLNLIVKDDEKQQQIFKRVKKIGEQAIWRAIIVAAENPSIKNMWTILFKAFMSEKTSTHQTKEPLVKMFQEVKLFNFLLRMQATYTQSKDRLSKQCFPDMLFNTTLSPQYHQEMTNRSLAQDEFQPLEKEQLLQTIEYIRVKTIKKNSYDLLLENCERWGKIVEELSLSEKILLSFSDISDYVFFKVRNQIGEEYFTTSIEQKQQFEEICQKIHQINKSKTFRNSQIEKDFQILSQFIRLHIKVLKKKKEDSVFKAAIEKIHSEEQNSLKEIERILSNDEKYLGRKQILALVSFRRNTVILPFDKIMSLISKMAKSKHIQLMIALQAFEKKEWLRNFVLERVFKASKYFTKRYLKENKSMGQNEVVKPEGINIILQPIPLSHAYFNEYYQYIREALLEYNMQHKNSQHKIAVTSLTASNYHSLAIFLHASDFNEAYIHKQIWNIEKLIKVDSITSSEIKWKWRHKQSWVDQIPQWILEAKMKLKRNQQNLLNAFLKENYVNNRSEWSPKIEENLRNSFHKEFQQSFDQIFELSLNGDSLKKIADHKMKGDRRNVKNLLQFLISKYGQIIRYVIMNSPQVSAEIKALDKDDQNLAWKGIILGKLISSFQIQEYVQEKLKQKNLDANINLHDFYWKSQKKIRMNFTVINMNTKCIEFINYLTRPHMPVWAAIVASASLPQFFQPLFDRIEWRRNIEGKDTMIQRNIFHQNYYNDSSLVSADILTTLPLNLLTNETIQRQMSGWKDGKIKPKTEGQSEGDQERIDYRKQVILCLSFSKNMYFLKNEENGHLAQKIVYSKIGLKNLLQKFVSYADLAKNFVPFIQKVPLIDKIPIVGKILTQPSIQKKNMNSLFKFSQIPIISDLLLKAEVYIFAHDNLMKKIYAEESVDLPVRVDVLDFHLMCIKNGDKEQLSPIVIDSIEQANYITSELIKNQFQREKKCFFMKVEPPNKGFDLYGNKMATNEFDLTIRFLSFFNTFNSTQQKFKILYTADPQVWQKQKQETEQFFASGNSKMLAVRKQYEYIRFSRKEKLLWMNVKKISDGKVLSKDFSIDFSSFNSSNLSGETYLIELNIPIMEPKDIVHEEIEWRRGQLRMGEERDRRSYLSVKSLMTRRKKYEIMKNEGRIPCENCSGILEIEIKRDKKGEQEQMRLVICKECPKWYRLADIYTFSTQKSKMTPKCYFCHQQLEICQRDGERCDLCQKVSNKNKWVDKKCGINICGICQIEAMINL